MKVGAEADTSLSHNTVRSHAEKPQKLTVHDWFTVLELADMWHTYVRPERNSARDFRVERSSGRDQDRMGIEVRSLSVDVRRLHRLG